MLTRYALKRKELNVRIWCGRSPRARPSAHAALVKTSTTKPPPPKALDLLHRTLEDEYYTALQAHLEALSTTTATAVPPAALKRKYMCSHCGVLKKGHVCPKATPKKRKGSSVRAVVKRARK